MVQNKLFILFRENCHVHLEYNRLFTPQKLFAKSSFVLWKKVNKYPFTFIFYILNNIEFEVCFPRSHSYFDADNFRVAMNTTIECKNHTTC